jgi:hypothetical protein
MGVRVGETKDQVVAKLGLKKHHAGNPWEHPPTQALLGQVLRPDDLDLEEDDLKGLETCWSNDGRICVVFFRDRVRGLVVKHPEGETGKKVRVEDNVSKVYRVYDPVYYDDAEVQLEDGKSARILRSPRLGVGFVIQSEHVTAIVLYPPGKR